MRSAVIACLVLAGCTAEARPPKAPSPSSYVRVIDGDTVEIRREKVRLSNIDAPELPPNSKCWAEAALAVTSAERLQEFINLAPTLELTRDGKDRYGRTLGRLVVGDGDLGEAMVQSGFAARWTGQKWDWCAPARYGDANGPNVLTSGPEANRAYTAWAQKHLAP